MPSSEFSSTSASASSLTPSSPSFTGAAPSCAWIHSSLPPNDRSRSPIAAVASAWLLSILAR